MNRSNQCFVILGMHRSATSYLARCLHETETDMGETLLGADRGNRKGHFENMAFFRLNEQILTAAGGSWDYPPPRKKILRMQTKFNGQIRETLLKAQHHAGINSWGWKDPRTSLTYGLYYPHLMAMDLDVFLVPMFRDPEYIALSLYKRDRMPRHQTLELANHYHNEIRYILETYV
jgi:hypothetical protein